MPVSCAHHLAPVSLHKWSGLKRLRAELSTQSYCSESGPSAGCRTASRSVLTVLCSRGLCWSPPADRGDGGRFTSPSAESPPTPARRAAAQVRSGHTSAGRRRQTRGTGVASRHHQPSRRRRPPGELRHRAGQARSHLCCAADDCADGCHQRIGQVKSGQE